MGVFVKLRGRKLGPFEDSQLQTMVRQGKIGRHNEVSLDGETWTSATSYAPLLAVLQTRGSKRDDFQSQESPLDLAQETRNSTVASSGVGGTKIWFVSSDGITGTGPSTQEEILELLRLKKLSLSCLAWKEGGEAKRLQDHAEFQSVPSGDDVVEAEIANDSSNLAGRKKTCPSCRYPMDADVAFCPRCGTKQKKETKETKSNGYDIQGKKGRKLVACRFCGEEISSKLPLCPYCRSVLDESQRKPRLTYILLGLLVLGWFGAHNFYAGRREVAKKQLYLGLTVVGLVVTIVWALVDVLVVRTDGKGLPFIE